jgi:hypothetical protein
MIAAAAPTTLADFASASFPENPATVANFSAKSSNKFNGLGRYSLLDGTGNFLGGTGNLLARTGNSNRGQR